MQVLQWALDASGRDRRTRVLVCASARLSAQNIAFSAVARDGDHARRRTSRAATTTTPGVGPDVGPRGRPDDGPHHVRLRGGAARRSSAAEPDRATSPGPSTSTSRSRATSSTRARASSSASTPTRYLYLTRVMDYFDPFADEEAAVERLRARRDPLPRASRSTPTGASDTRTRARSRACSRAAGCAVTLRGDRLALGPRLVPARGAALPRSSWPGSWRRHGPACGRRAPSQPTDAADTRAAVARSATAGTSRPSSIRTIRSARARVQARA